MEGEEAPRSAAQKQQQPQAAAKTAAAASRNRNTSNKKSNKQAPESGAAQNSTNNNPEKVRAKRCGSRRWEEGVVPWNFGFRGFFSGCKAKLQQLVRKSCGVQINCKNVLDILRKPPGVHTTAQEPKRAHLRVQNSTKRPPRENERMKIVAGEGKKRAKFWAAEEESGEGVSSGGGVRRSAQILDAPTKILNTHRTDTPHHNTTHHNTTQQQRHTTQHNRGSRTGWSWAREGPSQGGLWPKNQDMSNKLSRRAAPLAKVFGSRMVLKGLGTKWFDVKKEPQKWSEKPKNWKNKSKENVPLPFTQNKKCKKITKNGKHFSPLFQTPKSKKTKNQQQNQKIEKMLKERKSIQSIAQTFFNIFCEKKKEKCFAFSYFLFF